MQRSHTFLLVYLFCQGFSVTAQVDYIKSEDTYDIQLPNRSEFRNVRYDDATQKLLLCGRGVSDNEFHSRSSSTNSIGYYHPMFASIGLEKLNSQPTSTKLGLDRSKVGSGFYQRFWVDRLTSEIGFDRFYDMDESRYALGPKVLTCIDKNSINGEHKNERYYFINNIELSGVLKVNDSRYVVGARLSDNYFNLQLANDRLAIKRPDGELYGYYGVPKMQRFHHHMYPTKGPDGFHYMLQVKDSGTPRAKLVLIKMTFEEDGIDSTIFSGRKEVKMKNDLNPYKSELPAFYDFFNAYESVCRSGLPEYGLVRFNSRGNLVWLFAVRQDVDGKKYEEGRFEMNASWYIGCLEITPTAELVKFEHLQASSGSYIHFQDLDNDKILVTLSSGFTRLNLDEKEEASLEAFTVDINNLTASRPRTYVYSDEEAHKDVGSELSHYEVKRVLPAGLFKGPSGKFYVAYSIFYEKPKNGEFKALYTNRLVIAPVDQF